MSFFSTQQTSGVINVLFSFPFHTNMGLYIDRTFLKFGLLEPKNGLKPAQRLNI